MSDIKNNNKLPQLAQFCETVFEENKSVIGRGNALCNCIINSNLRRRKIYAWIYAQPSVGTACYVKANIVFFRNGSQLGRIPIGVSAASPAGLQQSLLNVCTTGGTPVSDSAGLYVATPVDQQPVSILLQPQYIYGEFDQANMEILETNNVTYCRLMLAIISN